MLQILKYKVNLHVGKSLILTAGCTANGEIGHCSVILSLNIIHIGKS